MRKAGECDATYDARVKKEILRERVTRSGMIKALTDLTGNAPLILEPRGLGERDLRLVGQRRGRRRVLGHAAHAEPSADHGLPVWRRHRRA
jgi:hypothetical protein